jgi:hypothetical protein
MVRIIYLMVRYIERGIFKKLDDSTISRRFQGKTRKMIEFASFSNFLRYSSYHFLIFLY